MTPRKKNPPKIPKVEKAEKVEKAKNPTETSASPIATDAPLPSPSVVAEPVTHPGKPRRKRRGSPPNRIYWWEALMVILKRWATRAGLAMGAIGQTAYEFCSENKTALMAAAPFWMAALALIVLGAFFSRSEIAEVKKADNTGVGESR